MSVTSSGRPEGSKGEACILQTFVASQWFGRMLERTHNQTDADVVIEAQRDVDAALTEITRYVTRLEMIAAAYAADAGGGRELFGTTQHTPDAGHVEGTKCPQLGA